MKSKLTTILAAVVLTLGLYSCTSSEDGFAGEEKASGFVTAYKTSEIVAYVGTDTLVSDLTRALPDGLTDKAYFYLRIDDRVLKAEGVVYNPTLYYPRTSGNGSLKSSVNEGKINLSYDFYAGLGTVPHYIYDPQGEEVLKALVDFLEYAKSKAGDPECLNMRSLTKYCITTYGYKIGNEVYDLFRGRIDTLNFKISKRDNRNLYFEYIGRP